MTEMVKPKRRHSNLSMENSKIMEKGRIRRLSQPRKGMKRHHLALIARKMVMMRTTAGSYIGAETEEIQWKMEAMTVTIVQYLRLDFGDETLITTMGAKGIVSVNYSSDSIANTSYLNEPVNNE